VRPFEHDGSQPRPVGVAMRRPLLCTALKKIFLYVSELVTELVILAAVIAPH
jgi:hypothetical protein